jgi:DNA mismatch endonuclease (patch repair protein)
MRVDPYPYPASAAVTAVMRANRRVDTNPELAVRHLLHAAGLRYRVDLLLTVGAVRVRPDVTFTRQRVAVFIDGCFWHGCAVHGTQPRKNPVYWSKKIARNKARDMTVTGALRAAGWTVIRAWEHEPPEAVSNLVRSAVTLRRALE